MHKYCDKCGNKCKKTLYGMFTILCNENKILCMDCNQFRLFATKRLHLLHCNIECCTAT